MRLCRLLLALVVLSPGLLGGCGSPNQAQKEPASSGSQAAAKEAKPQREPPAEAIAQFLDAVRRGDDQAATAMFTPLARQRANQIGLAISPRGSDTASFDVGKVRYVSETVAHVETTWSDIGEDGKRHSDPITWIVRKGAEGWRVAGMTAVIFPGEPPLALDFENPEEMLKKLEGLRSEMARRSQPDAVQAQRSKVPQDAFRR